MMDEEKQTEILGHAEELITEDCDKSQIAKDIMNSYIFGGQEDKAPYNYGTQEHYKIDEIYALVVSKYDELFPYVAPEVEEEESEPEPEEEPEEGE